MKNLGIYTQKVTTTSTSTTTIELSLVGRDVGISTIGNLIIVGVNTSFNSYAKYYNFRGISVPNGALYSFDTCEIYETSNISGTSVSVDFFPITGINYILEVKITPGSSLTTNWSVYYKDESIQTN
jgi:hypothetical protein